MGLTGFAGRLPLRVFAEAHYCQADLTDWGSDMSQSYDPYHLASPTVYLVKIVIFLVLVALVAAILSNQLLVFFWANPFINSLIFLVAVHRHHPEFPPGHPAVPRDQLGQFAAGRPHARPRQPHLLAPVAGLLRDRIGEAVITPSSMRSILDSVGNRLDEAKDTSRYLTGLLVFLGLLGTFYGLLETVTSVAGTIQALDATAGDTATLFANLKEGLAAPLGGMGTAFSASLLGLSGSLILGFLDLQTSQAQNAFYTDLEDWMTSMTELDHPVTADAGHWPRRLRRRDAGHDRHSSARPCRTPIQPERHPRHGRTGARHRWAGQAHPRRAGRPAQPHRSSRARPTRSCAN